MDFRKIHHLREIAMTDAQGNTSGMMQYSSQLISQTRPDFLAVPRKDQSFTRELYVRLGGRRRKGLRVGIQISLDISATDTLFA